MAIDIHNLLRLKGESWGLVTFIARHVERDPNDSRTKRLNFETIIPMPVDIRGTDEITRWREEHWGCRSHGTRAKLRNDPDHLEWLDIRFVTLTEEPSWVFHEIAKRYPHFLLNAICISETRDQGVFYAPTVAGQNAKLSATYPNAQLLPLFYDYVTGRCYDRRK